MAILGLHMRCITWPLVGGGVQNNHSYEIFDPYLPIHYATFMRLYDDDEEMF